MLSEINITRELLVALGFTLSFGLMFSISEIIYSRYKVDAEYTRKFVHVSCGSIAMLAAVVHVHFITIAILGTFFSILTWYMLSHNLLPSVHAVKRHSIGTVLFPIGVVLCVLFGLMTNYGITFFIPLSTMIYSDTIAAFIGVSYPIREIRIFKRTKSIGGSIAFFISAFFIYTLFFHFMLPLSSSNQTGKGVLFALTTAIVEFCSVDGWDDFTVPCAAFVFLWGSGY